MLKHNNISSDCPPLLPQILHKQHGNIIRLRNTMCKRVYIGGDGLENNFWSRDLWFRRQRIQPKQQHLQTENKHPQHPIFSSPIPCDYFCSEINYL